MQQCWHSAGLPFPRSLLTLCPALHVGDSPPFFIALQTAVFYENWRHRSFTRSCSPSLSLTIAVAHFRLPSAAGEWAVTESWTPTHGQLLAVPSSIWFSLKKTNTVQNSCCCCCFCGEKKLLTEPARQLEIPYSNGVWPHASTATSK